MMGGCAKLVHVTSFRNLVPLWEGYEIFFTSFLVFTHVSDAPVTHHTTKRHFMIVLGLGLVLFACASSSW